MMKLLILSLFFSLSMYAQCKDDYKTMIDSVITIKSKYEYDWYVKETNKKYPNNFLEKINKSNYKEYIENIYLLDSNYLPYFYDNSKSKIKFKSINIYDKRNRKILKKGEYGIDAWIVKPVLNGNVLTISILKCKIKLHKKQLNLINSYENIFRVKFKFSEVHNQWIRY